MKIVVTRRSDDYHACLESNTGIWGCGRNPMEAVGSFIITLASFKPHEVEIVRKDGA